MGESSYSVNENAPSGFAERLEEMEDEEIKDELLKSAMTVAHTKNAMDADPAVVSARSKVKEVSRKYRDAIKREDDKVQLCTKELSKRGYQGNPTEFDQMTFEQLQALKEKEQGEGDGEGAAAGKPKKLRRTAPLQSV